MKYIGIIIGIAGIALLSFMVGKNIYKNVFASGYEKGFTDGVVCGSTSLLDVLKKCGSIPNKDCYMPIIKEAVEKSYKPYKEKTND